MALFGPPNIEKLKARRDVQGLIGALNYKKGHPNGQNTRWQAASALGEVGDARAAEPLIDALNEEYIRNKAREALVKIGAPCVEPLIAALMDSRSPVRGQATYALWDIAEGSKDKQPLKKAVEPLISALADADRVVRANAAGSLGELADERAIKPLMGMLEDMDSSVRHNAIWALGHMADSRAIEALRDALKDSVTDLRRLAVWALGRIGGAGVTEPLVSTLKDQDQRVRESALEALEGLGWQPDHTEAGARYWIAKCEWARCVEIGPAAIPPLVDSLGYDDLKTSDRRAIYNLLAKLGWEPTDPQQAIPCWLERRAWAKLASLGADAVVPLVSVALREIDEAKLSEPYPPTVKGIGRTLIKIGDPAVDALIPLLEVKGTQPQAWDSRGGPDAWVLSKDQRVAAWAAEVLRDIPAERAAVPLAEAYIYAYEHNNVGYRDVFMAALRESVGADAKPLITVLQKGRHGHRGVADLIYWLGGLGDPSAVPAIRPYANLGSRQNPDARAAIWALGELRDMSAVPFLISLLEKPMVHDRAAVAVALGKLGDPSAVPHLLALLSEPERHIVAQALGSIRDPRVADALLALLNAKDPLMRGSVYHGLGDQGDPRAVAPLIHALLHERAWSERAKAAEALGKLGEPSAIEPLAQVLREPPPSESYKDLYATTPFWPVGEEPPGPSADYERMIAAAKTALAKLGAAQGT